MSPAHFARLAPAVRDDLVARGYDAEWWAKRPPEVRQTILNVYCKLRALDLWRFVEREDDSDVGKLHFRCPDVGGLKEAAAAADFKLRDRGVAWDASERRATASLHLKHFDGWPADKVQAHIDRAGLWLSRWWWWIFPVPLLQMVRHWLHYDGYLRVGTIRRLLLRQGLGEGLL